MAETWERHPMHEPNVEEEAQRRLAAKRAADSARAKFAGWVQALRRDTGAGETVSDAELAAAAPGIRAVAFDLKGNHADYMLVARKMAFLGPREDELRRREAMKGRAAEEYLRDPERPFGNGNHPAKPGEQFPEAVVQVVCDWTGRFWAGLDSFVEIARKLGEDDKEDFIQQFSSRPIMPRGLEELFQHFEHLRRNAGQGHRFAERVQLASKLLTEGQ